MKKQHDPTLIIVIGLIIFVMAFVSLRVTQEAKGHEKYEINSVWNED